MTLQDLPHTGEYIIIAGTYASLRPVMEWVEEFFNPSELETKWPYKYPEIILINESKYGYYMKSAHCLFTGLPTYQYNYDGTLTKIR